MVFDIIYFTDVDWRVGRVESGIFVLFDEQIEDTGEAFEPGTLSLPTFEMRTWNLTGLHVSQVQKEGANGLGVAAEIQKIIKRRNAKETQPLELVLGKIEVQGLVYDVEDLQRLVIAFKTKHLARERP